MKDILDSCHSEYSWIIKQWTMENVLKYGLDATEPILT
jgi:hypothetical protein